MSSSGKQPGYWLSVDVHEIDEFIGHELSSRIESLVSQQRALQETVAMLRPRLLSRAPASQERLI